MALMGYGAGNTSPAGEVSLFANRYHPKDFAPSPPGGSSSTLLKKTLLPASMPIVPAFGAAGAGDLTNRAPRLQVLLYKRARCHKAGWPDRLTRDKN